MKDFKATPLTIGAAAILLGGAIAVAAFVGRAGTQVAETCKRQVVQHQDRDVDRSHPDMPRKYVPRTEVSDKLHGIDKRLDRMETTQRTILREVRNGHDRGRSRRRIR